MKYLTWIWEEYGGRLVLLAGAVVFGYAVIFIIPAGV